MRFNPVNFLIVATTIGFFAVVTAMFAISPPEGNKEAIIATIGIIGSAWTAIVGYHFGSSSGSAEKTKMLQKHGNGDTP